MKYLSLLTKLSFLFVVLFSVSSCGTDDTITDEAPLVSLAQTNGDLWDDPQDVSGTDSIVVSVTAVAGTANMATLTVFEGADKVPLTRISLPANPSTISEADQTNYKVDVGIGLPSTLGEYSYSFEVEDADGLVGSESISVTTISTVVEPPTLTSTTNTVLTADAGTFVPIPITAAMGSDSLSTLSVLEDGTLIDGTADRLYLNGFYPEDAFPSNPLVLIDGELAGFTHTVYVKAHTTEGLEKPYSITVEDAKGETATFDFTITTNITTPTGTPISSTLLGVLFNQSGPSGTGGLDLDEGNSTGSADVSAEIRDMGSDFNEPADVNWRQLIAGVNGAEVRRVGSGVPETFDFSTVEFKEEIEGAFADSDPGSEFFVNIGDQFIVSGNGKYYLIKCTNIDIKPAAGDNGDSYTFDIKW